MSKLSEVIYISIYPKNTELLRAIWIIPHTTNCLSHMFSFLNIILYFAVNSVCPCTYFHSVNFDFCNAGAIILYTYWICLISYSVYFMFQQNTIEKSDNFKQAFKNSYQIKKEISCNIWISFSLNPEHIRFHIFNLLWVCVCVFLSHCRCLRLWGRWYSPRRSLSL